MQLQEIPDFIYLIQFGRTEKLMNTLNPIFVQKFIMSYFFEEIQHLRFQVWVTVFLPYIVYYYMELNFLLNF